MNDGFDADLDAASGLGGIEIAKFEKERAAGFDDFLRGGVSGLVHAALVAGEANDTSDPGTARGEFGAPHDFVGVAAVRGSPDVGDVEGAANALCAQVRFEKPVHQVSVAGKVL